MAIVETNWSQFLEANSELPTDVVFKVEEEEGEGEEKVRVGEVKAHMLLLAGVSPVFRGQFFGALKDNSGEVVVKDTTIEAFNVLIKIIYMKPEMKFSLKYVVNPQRLFCELVNLSEKYQIQGVKIKAKRALEEIPVTEENFINTAKTAKDYAAFEEVSQTLNSKCQPFLNESLRSAEDVYSFIVKTREKFPEFEMDILVDLLKSRNETASKTFHCATQGIQLPTKMNCIRRC